MVGRLGDSTFHNYSEGLTSRRKPMNWRIRSFFLIPLIAVAIVFSSAPPSSAEEQLIGTWEGAVFVNDKPIGVDLEITQIRTNTNGGVFHYGEPRACRLNIAYITVNKGSYWFALKESTGGYCDKLEGKRMQLVPVVDQSALNYEIEASRLGAEKETGTLQKHL
jgi:hypothetical protein